ncbi:hypothetical protein JCM3765_007794 [Sporobolomyces pararoseus]
MTSSTENTRAPPTPPDEPPPQIASSSTSNTITQSHPSTDCPASSTISGTERQKDFELLGEQGPGNGVNMNQSLSRIIQERWRNETPEVRERYRRDEEEEKEEEARRRAAREQRERG